MRTAYFKLFILAFCLFLFSFGAQNTGLEFKGDENFYFESANEMIESGDMLTPRYMGEERFQKPAFFYWLILLSFKIFGVSWFAARLPSIIFGALCALLVFEIASLLFDDKKIGLFAAFFFATTPLCYRYARLAVPDMTLVFFMTLALYYFVRFYKDAEGRKSAILFFGSMALAVLVKGPVGLILPLLITGIFCLMRREKRLFTPTALLAGIAVLVLITVPWFYIMHRVHGGAYISHVWSREILQRLSCGYEGCFIIGYFRGFFFYLGTLITKFLPYSLFMPMAFIASGRRLSFNSRRGDGRGRHIFLILWVALVFFFFTFVSERRTHYLLALSPAAAILTAVVFNSAIKDNRLFERAGFKAPYLAALIGIAIFAVLFVFSDYISGETKVSLWKYSILIIPVILILGLRFKKSVLMPSSLVLSLAIIYIATAISPPLGFFTNKMEHAASVIKAELREGDRVGIGSHGIIPEELQVYFDFPLDNVKVMYNSDGSPNLTRAGGLLRFLRSNERVFCVIKRKDYDIFIPKRTKKNLYILGRYYVWKRRVRIDRELRESISYAEPNFLREIFQNEIYIISNRK